MSAVTDFLATQGIFKEPGEDDKWYRDSDDGRQYIRGEAVDEMFRNFGFESQGAQARDANGNLLLALDDPQKLAQAQAAGAVQYVNGIPYANYMNNRGPQGSSALFPDMPQSGLGEFLGNLALVAGPAAFGGLGGFEALGAGGAGAALLGPAYSRAGSRYMLGDLIPGQQLISQALNTAAPYGGQLGRAYVNNK